MIQHFQQTLKSSRGGSQLVILLTLLVFISVGYAAWHIVPFYYYAEEIKGEMDAQAKKAQFKDDAKIRKYLLKKIKTMQLPIRSDDDLKINRTHDKIIIDLYYEEVFFVDFGGEYNWDIHIFEFNPRVERRI